MEPELERTPTEIFNVLSEISETLIEMKQDLHLIREATYGTTRSESRLEGRWEEPKHGEFGAIAESPGQIENMLMNIEHVVTEKARKK